MLKIKDNVDLKELEKFGFVKAFTPMTRIYRKNIRHLLEDKIKVEVDIDTRIITLSYQLKHGGESWTFRLDVLFDLIQAGLVEKINGGANE